MKADDKLEETISASARPPHERKISPFQFFIAIVLAIFLVELGIMAIFNHLLPPLHPSLYGLLDSLLLIGILYPVLFMWLLRPMQLNVKETRKSEERLRAANQKLEETLKELQSLQAKRVEEERLHALGTMASGIAHDFNNMLSPIVGFSELLILHPEYLKDGEKALRYLDLINTSARDAANVVSRLKEFYRYRNRNESLLPLNLNKIVKEAISLSKPKWKDQALSKGISIFLETSLRNVPSVPGNESELRQAIINLIFNAVDAMPADGTITISTSLKNGKVALELSDTGTGMTEEVRKHCMEPFFSTKGEYGTGLGLAMVYGIVRRHDGTIELQSELGKGTTFTLNFPVWKDRVSDIPGASLPGIDRSLRILVVDDEPMVREIVAEYLKGDGHIADTAVNGREALTRFYSQWYDLVITDMGMPEMNGEQMISVMHRDAPGKPVILMTGFGDLLETVPFGVKAVITKPVNLSSLRQAILDAVQSNFLFGHAEGYPQQAE